MKTITSLLVFAALVMSCSPLTLQADTDKTLVSWVTLSDKEVRAGSALTVQNGREFDGIVYAELAPGKWMAGSHNFARTKNEQADSPLETGDAKTLIQMAIVYQGEQITIYRDGELYDSYKAKNVDLLSQKSNIVVFGIRHAGGDGAIGGSIEDARIYKKVLSIAELRSLEPNKESTLKPYAWWDFTGKKVVERTGRYPHSKLTGGAKLADGKLVLGRNAMLIGARTESAASAGSRRRGPPKLVGPYVPETPAWPDEAPDNWAIYHLAHPTFTHSSPFDPNPAHFYKGRYHLHYIYRNQSGFSFAHVSSKDMVHWEWHPTVLAPAKTGHGMFSGTGFFTKQGQPAMVYCGWGSRRNWISYALDDSLDKWSKPEVMLPTDKAGKLMESMPYFDPDIWLNGDTYYGMNARSSREAPVIMKSKDLKNWQHIGELLHDDFDEKLLGVSKGEDISCPNMFKLGNKWLLLCISHRLGCRYFIGDFKDEQFLPESHGLIGGSTNRYFAPESVRAEDGRRVMWAWFRGGQTPGVQSLPTELALPKDGILRLRPIRELENLRYDEQREEDVAIGNNKPVILKGIKGDHLELEIVIKEAGEADFGLVVLCDAQGQDGLPIRVNREKKILEVANEKAPFELKKGEPLTLRIFVDSTLVEVFANDRQLVMSDKRWAAGAKINDRVALFSVAGLNVTRITAWKMKSAFDVKKQD